MDKEQYITTKEKPKGSPQYTGNIEMGPLGDKKRARKKQTTYQPPIYNYTPHLHLIQVKKSAKDRGLFTMYTNKFMTTNYKEKKILSSWLRN